MMQTKSISMYMITILAFAASCTMLDGEPSDEFRDGEDISNPPLLDETPLECNDDPITIETAEPIVVWPPSHKFTEVTLADCVASVSGGCLEDGADPNEVLHILSVTSDEAENYNGDGNTCGDTIMLTGESMVKVLAERSGSDMGDGRVYTINFEVAEGYGEGTGSCEIHVPLGHNVPVVNSDCKLCAADDDALCPANCDSVACP